MKEFLLLVIGFALGHVPGWLDRKRKLKTHWHAIRAEMILVKEKVEILLNDGIQAPLYRLPVVAYETSFPILLAEGVVTEEEVKIVGRCFAQVQDINRGLENATELYKSGNDKLNNEYERNCLKARTLLGKDGKESLFDAAKTIVGAKIELPWWKY